MPVKSEKKDKNEKKLLKIANKINKDIVNDKKEEKSVNYKSIIYRMKYQNYLKKKKLKKSQNV